MTTADVDDAALVAEARRFVGLPAAGSRIGRDPVNVAMIHHWCDALDDRNPRYADGNVAPPAMLASWTLDAAEVPEQGPRDEVLRRLERAGYTAVIATDYEQEHVRELRPGDRLAEAISVEELSERKVTRLGPGFFVTVRHDYRDQDGDLVGVARMRLLKYRPGERDGTLSEEPSEAPPAATRRPRPPINRDNAFFWEGVAAGELRIQRCTGCGRLRHPPRPMCGACQSTAWDTVIASGRGTVYSYAIHHHPPLPGIALPLVVVLVELPEGVRMVSTLTGSGSDDVAIGLPVEVVFERVDADLVLPLFRVARQ